MVSGPFVWLKGSVILGFRYMFDRENAAKLNPDVQEGLFIMAVANSCVNPLVYGSHTKECRETVIHCCIEKTKKQTQGGAYRPPSKFPSKFRVLFGLSGVELTDNLMK